MRFIVSEDKSNNWKWFSVISISTKRTDNRKHFYYLAEFLFNSRKQITKKIIPYTVVIGVAIPT